MRSSVNPTNFSKSGFYQLTYHAIDNFNNESELVLNVVIKEYVGHFNNTNYLDYYSGLKQAENKKNFLYQLLYGSNSLKNYGEARNILELADRDPANFYNVLLIYDRSSIKGEWDWPNWEREHVCPNSKLGVLRIENQQTNRASDLHNLRAINPGINSSRNNLPYALAEDPTDSYGHVLGGYYPGYDDRGDVARIIFCMNALYGLDINLVETLETLLMWDQENHPVDFEIYCNEIIFHFQKNRNPYIDYPSLALEIYGN